MSVSDSFHISQYTVVTAVYEGPLDLLLQLIERAELDITRLALAQVTDQYLEHLHNIPESTAEEVSAFLVVASKLLQIKSEALLPRPPVREPGEEDPGDTLTRQLLAYKRFKELANLLAGREAANLRTFPRVAPAPQIDAALDLGTMTLDDLLLMAQQIFAQTDSRPSLASVVKPPRVTIREKIGLIASYLRQHTQGTFDQLIQDPSARLEVVVTFLALLELIKRRMVSANQASLFGQIEFQSLGAWHDEEMFELEFIE
jgi:segregation and condensation protein A